jgi:protein-S-isoprenylcysteine O-methyltransferase Ste14
MLDRFELLIGVGGAWVVSLIVFIVVQLFRGSYLPSGSIAVESDVSAEDLKAPGTRWSRLGFSVGYGYSVIILFSVLILCILDYWENFPKFLFFNFPRWMNLVSLISIWCYYVWGISVFVYNVNYSPNFKPIKNQYVLATGGPYKLVRHPMYVSKAILPILIFFLTGIWLVLFGLVSWLTIKNQSIAEEELLLEMFGEKYSCYAKRTGRFFPKV